MVVLVLLPRIVGDLGVVNEAYVRQMRTRAHAARRGQSVRGDGARRGAAPLKPPQSVRAWRDQESEISPHVKEDRGAGRVAGGGPLSSRGPRWMRPRLPSCRGFGSPPKHSRYEGLGRPNNARRVFRGGSPCSGRHGRWGLGGRGPRWMRPRPPAMGRQPPKHSSREGLGRPTIRVERSGAAAPEGGARRSLD